MKPSSHSSIKYLTPQNLREQISKFTKNMATTHGIFNIKVKDCLMQDIEWNHMDQMHRFSIHNTYEENVRIACGENFAVSLTKWGKWPFFITVSDVYIAEGLFYQTLTIAGVFVLHSIITMKKVPDEDSIHLSHEWIIASHKLFKIFHKIIDKGLYKLNVRLQQEDEELRQERYHLRKKGYTFKTDKPNYYNSNRLSTNTIYPPLQANNKILISEITAQQKLHKIGNLDFIIKKTDKESYQIWPAICPHEGGQLINGEICNSQIICPWHHLKFSAVELSAVNPHGIRYGFEYTLENGQITVEQIQASEHSIIDTLAVHA